MDILLKELFVIQNNNCHYSFAGVNLLKLKLDPRVLIILYQIEFAEEQSLENKV